MNFSDFSLHKKYDVIYSDSKILLKKGGKISRQSSVFIVRVHKAKIRMVYVSHFRTIKY